MKRFVRPLVLMVAVGVLGGCGQSDKDLAALDRPALTKLTSSPTLALRVTGGGFPLLGDSCSRSTGFLLHRAA